MRGPILVMTLIVCPAVAAEEPLPPPPVPERVEVTATRVPEDPQHVPATVDVVTGDELRAMGANDLRSALALIPGVDIAPGGDNGPASAVPSLWGLREFDAFLLVVDGVPYGGSFNPDLATLPMDQIERIEVVRGPAPVFYGATSFSGVIQVVRTPPEAAREELRASAGTWGSGELRYGTPLPSMGGFKSSVSVDAARRGYRDDRTQYDRAQAHASGATAAFGGNLAVNLDLNWLDQDPGSPHPREGAALSSNVPLDANHNPGGARLDGNRATLTGRYDRRAGKVEWAATASASTASQSVLRGFLVDVSETDPNAVGFRQDIDQTDVYLDGHAVIPLGAELSLVAGIDHLQGSGDAAGGDFDYFIPLDGSTPPPGSDIPSASDVRIEDRRAFSGLYANLEWHPADRWRVDVGARLNRTAERRNVRAEEFGAGPAEVSEDTRTTTRGSGALGVVWTAWRRDASSVDLYASARDTFKPAAIDFGVDADPEILDPETATSYELGAKWAVGRGSASLSFFRMDMQNLVVSQVVDGLPSLENAGETRFQGIEARGAWRWTGALHLTAAYSLQDARFRDYLTEFDGVPTQLAGKRVEMTARDMASAGLVYAPKVGWHGSTVVQWVGARWLNKRNTALARDYVTWSAGVGYHFHTVDLRVDGWNLNDQRPPVAESEVGDAQYYRLPARSAAVSLTWVR